MKIFFKGYYGFNNIGDDIFVHTIDWFCKKYNYKYLIHGYNLPLGIKGKSVKSRGSKNIYDLIYSIKSKRIIYWGGSTFEQISSKSDLKYLLNKFNFFSKKVLAMGISIGPFNDEKSRNKITNFVDKMQFVGVRDKASINYSKNLEFTFDLAIITPLIFPNCNKPRENKTKDFVISLNISEAENYDEYTKTYREFLLNNKESIKKVNILVFNTDDYEDSIMLYNKLKESFREVNIINYSSDTKYIVEKIASSDLLLGNRLHSAIIAYSYNVPFILNEYHQKCSDFLKTINMQYKYNELKNNPDESIIRVIENTKNCADSQYFRELLLEKLEKLAKVIRNEDL
ncbi:hypothetical protein SEQU_10260 [Staphylococcus equorum UMC-CNS-924]|uniref:polysaccharide pyruvyl transferase family protein n=1 Tax=Staphylococcus equorum TaxID=246432 RepID=UPI0003968EC6|nr:polysaccharide pyruvyl transferase family protein [Staphylococcus equorum]ERH34506.1 hypothetical protein SEQU_10260 [Staphylococcus equorum UMC-CNS-924]MEB8172355.1 polysaccharide pyruvyl transferase family protein [Staphylococcus equorum]